jgi:mono/diheme cytochrome c family protein
MEHRRRTILILLTATALGTLWMVPIAAGQARVANGADLFHSYCVVCHGTDARGTGPLASSLTKRPADLTMLAATNGGTFPAEMVGQIIDGRKPVKGHGGGDMPVWGEALLKAQGAGTEESVKERIDALVSHLRSLQK